MAYRRKQPFSRASTFTEDFRSSREDSKPSISRFSTFKDDFRSSHSSPSSPASSSTLAAQAIRASSAHRDSSISSAYGESAYREPSRQRLDSSEQQYLVEIGDFISYKVIHHHSLFPKLFGGSRPYEYTSIKSLNESKDGFWGVLARKAKSILEDDNVAQKFEVPGRTRPQMLDTSTGDQFHQSSRSPESSKKSGSPRLQKGLDAITSSLNYLGDTLGNALEEGLTIMETRTADIISETRKLHIRRKGSNSNSQYQANDSLSPRQALLQMQTDQETQLKASRDVAMAMAAKAKLLLRELKTVKADLAFAKERCRQLEEENKILRESREKGDTPEDDDLIRLQLETLLAEKGRLANENSDYARENRFLREIVEYHQLTMQDVVYLDEGIEDVTEVCPITIIPVTDVHRASLSPPPPSLLPDTSRASAAATTPADPIQNQMNPDAVPIRTSRAGSPADANPTAPVSVTGGENLKRQRSPTPPPTSST